MEPLVTSDENQNFSNRLNYVLDRMGVPPKGKGRQDVVAKMFNVSQKGARKWLEGEGMPKSTKHPEFIAAFKKLSITGEWLFYGNPNYAPDWIKQTPTISDDNKRNHPEGEVIRLELPGQVNESLGEWSLTNQKDQLIKVKLIDWSTFCLDSDSIIKIKELSTMIIPKDITPSAQSYIIEIDRDIFKHFPVGTQLLINPEGKPVKNSFVLLSIGDNIPTLVRWNPGLGELQIEPLESGYPNSISLENKDYTILGVAIYEQQKGRKL